MKNTNVFAIAPLTMAPQSLAKYADEVRAIDILESKNKWAIFKNPETAAYLLNIGLYEDPEIAANAIKEEYIAIWVEYRNNEFIGKLDMHYNGDKGAYDMLKIYSSPNMKDHYGILILPTKEHGLIELKKMEPYINKKQSNNYMQMLSNKINKCNWNTHFLATNTDGQWEEIERYTIAYKDNFANKNNVIQYKAYLAIKMDY